MIDNCAMAAAPAAPQLREAVKKFGRAKLMPIKRWEVKTNLFFF
jgi:hypothetical protein